MPKWATGSKSRSGKSLGRGASPPPQPPEVTGSTAIRFQEFIGPLPPPRDLRDYEQVVEGTAERILQMAEREQRIGHELGVAAATTKAMALAGEATAIGEPLLGPASRERALGGGVRPG